MLYDGLEIYQALIEDEVDGIIAISLVDYPAVERDFICFKSNEHQQVRFSIENEEKHNISGVVMLADTPIYRRNGDYEYYIIYSKDTIAKMANKMLKDGTQNNIDIMHDGELITGISMTELYIKDSSKGINPNFIDDVPDGSLMSTFHIEDNELWDAAKNGNLLNGFSLEGLFTIEKMSKNNKIKSNNTMSKFTKFVKSLMKFGVIPTDKGTLYWDGENEIAVDVEVYVDGENDEKVIAPDGEYRLDDERVIVVVDGKVSEIREKATDEPEVIVNENFEDAEVIVDEPETVDVPDERDERISRLEDEIESLRNSIDEIRQQLAELIDKPAVEPIIEEFEAVNKPEVKVNKAARLFSHLKK